MVFLHGNNFSRIPKIFKALLLIAGISAVIGMVLST